MSVFYKHPLPLPLGEVDERSEDGEGKPGCNALSVAYGDSSPKGRAKGGVPRHEKWRASPLPLPLGEVDERSEDGEGKPGCNALSVAYGDSSPKGRAKGGVPRHEKWRASPLPLPLGEVDERSEDGEGKPGCNTLSVACGDSSPKGRAKGVYHGTKNGAHLPCLSLWERWLSAARTERGNRGAIPSQSPTATALPKGEPRGCTFHFSSAGKLV